MVRLVTISIVFNWSLHGLRQNGWRRGVRTNSEVKKGSVDA